MLKHSFVVHSGDSMNGDVFFMEVSGPLNARLPPQPPPRMLVVPGRGKGRGCDTS